MQLLAQLDCEQEFMNNPKCDILSSEPFRIDFFGGKVGRGVVGKIVLHITGCSYTKLHWQ
jgi:hypothetical protein